jgi:ribosome-associated translation inhibitor RaiA
VSTISNQPVFVEHGDAAAPTIARARKRITHALAHVHRPVGPVYVSIHAATRGRGGPHCDVHVHVDVDGETICAHASAASAGAAIELVHDRLREQVERSVQRRDRHRRD